MRSVSAIPFLVAAVTAQSTAGPYGQCGGTGYTGPSACGSGYGCTTYNPYYAQCYPGAATATPSTTSTAAAVTPTTTKPSTTLQTSTTKPITTITTITTTTTTTTTTTAAAAATSTAPTGTSPSTPTTLVSGWYWIRAVASPNFHKYLQTSPLLTPSTALLNDHTTAGQFNVIDGQLVYYRGASASPLYLTVENPTDKTQRKLWTKFSATKNVYGTFAFQGDTLTWSVSDITRPNVAAWLVCAGQEVFVNTGAYAYDTPAGCADQTIHYYGGSTADL
ncbi:hypothetical protein B0T19DRAFT_148049 [Cercophora scortea]|uniref:CBM1 domain-containing protein n=1 Tax=Cercophora scortea TaxID=314031 RepID=A0AAE0MIY6_9PEZI|nr:hypothetical protein B0T19DRAFT_148049 [Cercophora scortea]